MHIPLLLSHRHKQNFIHPPGQLESYIFFPAANQYVLHLLANGIQILVRNHLTRIRPDNSLVKKLIIRSQTKLVDKLHDGIKFLQLILQWSTG